MGATFAQNSSTRVLVKNVNVKLTTGKKRTILRIIFSVKMDKKRKTENSRLSTIYQNNNSA